MTNIYDMNDKWDDANTTFTSIKMDAEDVASSNNSLLLNLLVDGESKASVDKHGNATFAGNIYSVGANNINAQVTGTLTVNTISANGTTGSAGQVLTTNGSNVYWFAVTDGTVTQVNTGVGLTGGPIDTTGTISVNPNTGIIANASGVFVNSAYIATLDANNASYLNGNTAATLRTYSETTAATAYTNATSYADTAASTAYSNAVSTAATDATNKAANAYSNAVSYAGTIAATAYSNATSYADTVAGTAYSNAVSAAATDATNKAANAYSNAVSYAASIAATAYSNSVSYFDSNVNTAIDARVTKSFVDALNVDANTLNGQLGSYYLDWTNVTNKPDPTITVTLTGDVTGSGNTTLTDLANGNINITTSGGVSVDDAIAYAIALG